MIDKKKLLDWIDSEITESNETAMKWVGYNVMKGKFDVEPLPEITFQHTGEMAPTLIGYSPKHLYMSEVDKDENMD